MLMGFPDAHFRLNVFNGLRQMLMPPYTEF
jgi:hypothetical protein